MKPHDLLSIGEVAAQLRCSECTVNRRIAAGFIVAVYEGGRKLVRQVDLKAYMSKLPQTKGQEYD